MMMTSDFVSAAWSLIVSATRNGTAYTHHTKAPVTKRPLETVPRLLFRPFGACSYRICHLGLALWVIVLDVKSPSDNVGGVKQFSSAVDHRRNDWVSAP